MFDSPDHPHRRGKPPTVQVFENKGAIMGRSNPHTHGQARADGFVPNEAATEDPRRRDCFAAHARPPLLDCAEVESGGTRPVVESDQWIAPVPCGAARCLRAVGPVHHNQR